MMTVIMMMITWAGSRSRRRGRTWTGRGRWRRPRTMRWTWGWSVLSLRASTSTSSLSLSLSLWLSLSPSCCSPYRTGRHRPAAARSESWEMREYFLKLILTFVEYTLMKASLFSPQLGSDIWLSIHWSQLRLLRWMENPSLILIIASSILTPLHLASLHSLPVTSVYKHYIFFVRICIMLL